MTDEKKVRFSLTQPVAGSDHPAQVKGGGPTIGTPRPVPTPKVAWWKTLLTTAAEIAGTILARGAGRG